MGLATTVDYVYMYTEYSMRVVHLTQERSKKGGVVASWLLHCNHNMIVSVIIETFNAKY